jgi:hypothetical protein
MFFQGSNVFANFSKTLASRVSKKDSIPFVAGLIGAFVLLPKMAYDEADFPVSCSKFCPQVLPYKLSYTKVQTDTE